MGRILSECSLLCNPTVLTGQNTMIDGKEGSRGDSHPQIPFKKVEVRLGRHVDGMGTLRRWQDKGESRTS